jgi:hypothetical protein
LVICMVMGIVTTIMEMDMGTDMNYHTIINL